MRAQRRFAGAQVRDAAFLHRYNEPVLLVLHEPAPTWAGAARERRDTAALVALSLNVQQRRHTRLWAAERLPADALRVAASPAGGALVLCQSLLLYHTQARRGSACKPLRQAAACPVQAGTRTGSPLHVPGEGPGPWPHGTASGTASQTVSGS